MPETIALLAFFELGITEAPQTEFRMGVETMKTPSTWTHLGFHTPPYRGADSPTTPPQSVVRQGGKYHADTGEPVADRPSVGPRTYGDSVPGATTMLRGTYHLRGAVRSRASRQDELR